MPVNTQPATILRFGAFELDLRASELRKKGVRVKLQGQPFQVLTLLLQHPTEVVSREELRSAIWPGDTFVDFDNSLNTAVNKLREALGDSAENPRFIETLPRRGYRFIAPVATMDGVAPGTASNSATTAPARQLKLIIAAAALLFATVTAGTFFWRYRQNHRLNDKDTIVLTDFNNTTGDPVFDDALKQGLRVQLEQSPFLNILSDEKVTEELRLMGRPPDQRLAPDIARDLCQRVGSKAILAGSISSLGTHYVIGLNALNCLTGDELGSEQTEADDQEHVLRALGQSATNIRKKLGESRSSIRRYDTPLEEATTPSLEALKAYSQGMKTWRATGVITALPFFQRAVELDPTFAMAYARLGTIYAYLRQPVISGENTRKGYELRAKVSERERLYIEEAYSRFVTWNQEKVVQFDEVWQQTYPQDVEPYHELAFLYARLLGKYEAALDEAREAVRLEPDNEENYSNLCYSYRWLNRLDDAEVVLKQAQQRKLQSENLLEHRYDLAFLRGDKEEIAQLMLTSTNKMAVDYFHDLEASAEAYHGRLRKSRELFRAETGDGCRVCARLSLIEAHFGLKRQARIDAYSALKVTGIGDSNLWKIGLALALAGDSASAEKLAKELNESYPQHTIIQRYWLPTSRAAVALEHKNADQAVELLRATSPYELSAMGMGSLEPIYLRGQAYLMQHNSSAAVVEFQKIIDHPGIVKTEEAVVGPLAGLGLARAYALEGDTAKSRRAYQDFLALWKDADPDIPILKQAKAEYAKLQ
jgi:eukaryotic-like serine/threonine-protein kinase